MRHPRCAYSSGSWVQRVTNLRPGHVDRFLAELARDEYARGSSSDTRAVLGYHAQGRSAARRARELHVGDGHAQRHG